MMAAISAGELKQDVSLIEKNPALGRKLLLSGKGRCNLTNACALEEFLKRFSRNGEFLRDAFKVFFNKELMSFFTARGLKLNIERQMRVFPACDKSASVLGIIKNELAKNKVRVLYNCRLKDILLKGSEVRAVELSGGKFIYCDRVILATGGVSYGFTGSSGEGLEIVRKLGHHIVPLRAGLVALKTKERYFEELKGITLKNVRLIFSDCQRKLISGVGELLFTDFGVSGPLVLTLSGQIVDWLLEKKRVYLDIDLKPALSYGQLEARLLGEFKSSPRKNIKNIMKSLLPQRMADVFLGVCGISCKNASQITQEERRKIINQLKGLRLEISGPMPTEEAMITRGGVSLKEVDPRTMQSRLIKGLYFAGEMLDIDADTGGFNLQAAFSTGYLAGESAALN